jgi:CDP-glycerol glycerophosphotransferase (TagB/SpsB family)
MGRDFYLFIYSIIGWLIAFPLSLLIPVKPNSIVFIGRQDGMFIDNVKYFYLYINSLKDKNIDCYFLTENSKVYEELKKKNLPILLYPSFKSIFKLLRTSVVIMDDGKWFFKAKYYFLLKAYKVQLWHGVGFKKLGDDSVCQRTLKSFIKRLRWKFEGRFPDYDLFVSTSEFYTENVFKPAFAPKQLIESGYPRNDIMFKNPDELDLLGTDLISINKIKEYKESGYKIILYAPTFRDRGGDAIIDKALDLDKLSEFAEKNKMVFVFKFHSLPDFEYKINYENIIVYDNSKDIYPVFSDIDLMITDYSSIYMDYLLLKRPVIFFSYDLEKYMNKDHKIQFDYNWITPGPKCINQTQLEHEIIKFVRSNDEYKKKRDEIRNIAFKYSDNRASERIWDFIRNKLKLLPTNFTHHPELVSGSQDPAIPKQVRNDDTVYERSGK